MLKQLYDLIIQKSVQITTFILIIISLIIFLQNDHPSVRNIQMKFADALAPVKEPVIWFDRQIAAKEENYHLMKRIAELNREAGRFAVLAEENKRLRALLDFREKGEMDLLPALVLSAGLQNNMNGVLLNRGADDSVNVNDPIINIDGVIGKVVETGQQTSLAEILAAPNARISVRIQPSGARGILQWYGENRFLIKDIPGTMPVAAGNLVVSSGYSDIYPPDLPVGIVESSQKAADGFTYAVYGKLLVNFNRLEEVLILRNNEKFSADLNGMGTW